MERRNLIFQQLKPHCVKLSQVVLRVAAQQGNSRDVGDALRNLLTALQEAATYPGALNDKLAEYVFFPLSHILREKQKLPVAALELTLQCLAILLQTGWRANVDPALSRQFLILLPALISGGSQGPARPSSASEELQAAAFKCLSELFTTYSQHEQSRKALIAADNIPPLGHAVVVILEGVSEGRSNTVQLAAAEALRACCNALRERDALASFLPGIVSNLAKVLTPSTKQRRSFEILCISLEVLSNLFQAVLSDHEVKNLPASEETPGSSEQKLTQSWLKATVAQVKLALANIIRIRQNPRAEIKKTLLNLCLVVLEDCRDSLKDSAAMMIETMTVLCGSDEQGEMKGAIRQIITADSRFAELLRSSIHNWIVSLPRIMQSPDDDAKRRLVRQLSTGYELLAEQGVDLGLVDRALAENLRDGISTAVLDQTKAKAIAPVSQSSMSLDLTLPTRSEPSVEFEPVFYENTTQQEIIHDLRVLVKHVSTSKSSLTAARELIDSLQFTKGASQVASFWVSLQLIKSSTENEALMDDFLDLGDTAGSLREELLEEMYSFSLDVLQGSSLDSESDWRLKALAMETIALQAQTLKTDFRIEFVDALYPIVHLVGSQIPQLRNHAITCLNIIAADCDFKDVGSLVVENVDYLVNAVALKLNTFDISPQAPQVLLMMIKLSGPSLLPYLDDLVGSVFAALESFHGYPKLVELLFSVLKGIAEEGAKTPQLAITEGEDATKSKADSKKTTIDDIVSALKDIQTREAKQDDPEELNAAGPFPKRPWKDPTKDKKKNPLITELDSDDDDEDEDENADNPDDAAEEENEADADADASPPDPPPPAPKTYSLLLSISQLTQHYLASASAPLRTSLLQLLDTTVPALARHENSFLPLVDTLWPTLVPRLDDGEAYVVSGALEVMGKMCEYAGDFMRGRVEAVWVVLVRLWREGGREKGGAAAGGGSRRGDGGVGSGLLLSGGSGSGGLRGGGQVQPYYTSAPTRIIRAALVELFTTVVRTVQISEKDFQEVLELLLPVVAERKDVREVFERRNADAVWLALLRWETSRKKNKEGEGLEGRSDNTRVGRDRPGAWEGREFASVGVVG